MQGLLALLSAPLWYRHTAAKIAFSGAAAYKAGVDAVPSAAVDCTLARFVEVSADDGTLYVEVGTSGTHPTLLVATDASARVYSGQTRIFQVPMENYKVGGTISAKISVLAASGTVNGTVRWGM